MTRPIEEQTEIEQLLRTSPQLRDAGFSASVVQRLKRNQRHRRMILGSVWMLAICASLLAAALIVPWRHLVELTASIQQYIAEYTALLTPAGIEHLPTTDLLQNNGVLLIALSALVIIFFAGVIAQD